MLKRLKLYDIRFAPILKEINSMYVEKKRPLVGFIMLMCRMELSHVPTDSYSVFLFAGHLEFPVSCVPIKVRRTQRYRLVSRVVIKTINMTMNV